MKITQKISAIAHNKEAKTVAGNFMWLSLLQVAGYAFPLITMPYLARVIGVDGFGKIAFAMAIMVWIQTIADWGFNLTATRDVAQNRDNKDKVSEIFSNVLWARCLLMLVSLIVLLLLIVTIPTFREQWDIILITFLIIPGHIVFPDWFFQAIEKMRYITILNVLMKLLFTFAVFIFIKQPEDFILQPLFTSLGYVISGLIAIYYILFKWGYNLYKPNWGAIIQTIKSSTDVFINHLMPNLYNSFSIMLLGFLDGGLAVGLLDGANKFVHIGTQLQTTINRAFYPFLSRRIDKHTLYVVVVMGISSLMAIALFFGASLLVEYTLSPEFADSVHIIRIRAVSLIFSGMCGAYGANYLIIKHQEAILRKITMWCSIFGFIIAWPLVYFYSYIGAALTTTISLGLLAVSYYIISMQIKINQSKS